MFPWSLTICDFDIRESEFYDSKFWLWAWDAVFHVILSLGDETLGLICSFRMIQSLGILFHMILNFVMLLSCIRFLNYSSLLLVICLLFKMQTLINCISSFDWIYSLLDSTFSFSSSWRRVFLCVLCRHIVCFNLFKMSFGEVVEVKENINLDLYLRNNASF